MSVWFCLLFRQNLPPLYKYTNTHQPLRFTQSHCLNSHICLVSRTSAIAKVTTHLSPCVTISLFENLASWKKSALVFCICACDFLVKAEIPETLRLLHSESFNAHGWQKLMKDYYAMPMRAMNGKICLFCTFVDDQAYDTQYAHALTVNIHPFHF